MHNARYIPIENYTNLVRDTQSMAVINKDTASRLTVKNQKKYILKMHQQLTETQDELVKLRNEVAEIRSLINIRRVS